MADAIVSENRLRSASKGAATGTGYANGSYRGVKREDQPGQQWYWFISFGDTPWPISTLDIRLLVVSSCNLLNSFAGLVWSSGGRQLGTSQIIFKNSSHCGLLCFFATLPVFMDFYMARAATTCAWLLTSSENCQRSPSDRTACRCHYIQFSEHLQQLWRIEYEQAYQHSSTSHVTFGPEASWNMVISSSAYSWRCTTPVRAFRADPLSLHEIHVLLWMVFLVFFNFLAFLYFHLARGRLGMLISGVKLDWPTGSVVELLGVTERTFSRELHHWHDASTKISGVENGEQLLGRFTHCCFCRHLHLLSFCAMRRAMIVPGWHGGRVVARVCQLIAGYLWEGDSGKGGKGPRVISLFSASNGYTTSPIAIWS
jgi:hypothetical protein